MINDVADLSFDQVIFNPKKMVMRRFSLMTFLPIFRLAGLAFLFVVLAQCGGSSPKRSDDVRILIIPQEPVVIDADITIRPGQVTEIKVSAPWFPFRFRVRNDADQALVIVTFKFDITISNNGVLTEFTSTIDPSQALGTPEITLTDDAKDENGAISGAVHPNGGDFEYLGSWFIHSLPEGDNFRYSVTVTPLGWFQDIDNVPQERLKQTYQILTQ